MKFNTIFSKHDVSLYGVTATAEETGQVGAPFEFTECFAHQIPFKKPLMDQHHAVMDDAIRSNHTGQYENTRMLITFAARNVASPSHDPNIHFEPKLTHFN
jgi:hypothetical protein